MNEDTGGITGGGRFVGPGSLFDSGKVPLVVVIAAVEGKGRESSGGEG